jgi:hypothetical protein
MPRVRKLTLEEVQAIERRTTRQQPPPLPDMVLLATYGLTDAEGESPPPPGVPTRRLAPRVGDIVELAGTKTGIVIRVRAQTDGGWDAAELLVCGRRRWARASEVGRAIGRPKGITRIDHPRHRTHGWFVRLYAGKLPRVARLFSDQKYHGRAAALAAAMAFHAVEEQCSPPPRRRRN